MNFERMCCRRTINSKSGSINRPREFEVHVLIGAAASDKLHVVVLCGDGSSGSRAWL